MSNNALNFGSGNHYRSKLQIFLESENLTQIAIQIKGKMSKLWPSEHRLTKLAHLYDWPTLGGTRFGSLELCPLWKYGVEPVDRQDVTFTVVHEWHAILLFRR